MKTKKLLIGAFENVSDAKNALGRIKKATWNRADLALIVPRKSSPDVVQGIDFELASESFLDLPRKDFSPLWPGLRQESLAGVGEVLIGQGRSHEPEPLSLDLSQPELEMIKQPLKQHKIITVLKANPEDLPKLRLIMETDGAELL
ncbi:MAG TPA: hypothetical protein VF531_06375 [Bacillota bacterium]